MLSIKPGENERKYVAKITANTWFYLISNHPFVDGNKRTATEAVKLFFDENNYYLDMLPNGFIYISLKIANNEMKLAQLTNLIEKRLKEK